MNKPEIKKIGTYTEDNHGNIFVNGWEIHSSVDCDPLSLEELKNIAIEHDTYSYKKTVLDKGTV